jgi:hypothetical protein
VYTKQSARARDRRMARIAVVDAHGTGQTVGGGGGAGGPACACIQPASQYKRTLCVGRLRPRRLRRLGGESGHPLPAPPPASYEFGRPTSGNRQDGGGGGGECTTRESVRAGSRRGGGAAGDERATARVIEEKFSTFASGLAAAAAPCEPPRFNSRLSSLLLMLVIISPIISSPVALFAAPRPDSTSSSIIY